MQAKRLFAGLLSAVLLMTLLPVSAAAAEYTPPALPDVFQGDGLYITATPLEPQIEGEYVAVSGVEGGFHEGWAGFVTQEETRDQYGYLDDTYWALHYVDRNGRKLDTAVETSNYSDPHQSIALNFYDGMCAFYDRETERFGYLDAEGNVAIEPKFTEAYAFSNGLAAVSEVYGGSEHYYIDKNGNKVLGPFGRAAANEFSAFFSEGLLPQSDYLDRDNYFVGYVDQQGEPAITLYSGEPGGDKLELMDPGLYIPDTTGSHFSEGYAIVKDQRNGRKYPIYLIIDTEGNEVGRIDPGAPMTAAPYSVVQDGLIIVRFTNTEGGSGGGIGAVDIHGNIVVEPGRVSSGNAYFDSGVAPGNPSVGLVIDKKGNAVLPGSFADAVGVDADTLMAEARTAYNAPAAVLTFNMEVSNFDDGLSLLTVELWSNGMSVVDKWYYVLEVHEGTYTGGGKVYNAATGQITGGGSTPTDPETPTEPAGGTPSSWAVENVNTAVEAGIVPETLQSAYTQATTRAEFCALAVELYETVMGTEITERATFSDTTDVNVEKMAGLGVVNGVGDGKFDPSASLTREEAAAMLARLANVMEKPLTSGTASFADNTSISSWAVEAVGQVQASGIMNGIEGNQFAPSDPYTREQSIVTMLRLYDFVK